MNTFFTINFKIFFPSLFIYLSCLIAFSMKDKRPLLKWLAFPSWTIMGINLCHTNFNGAYGFLNGSIMEPLTSNRSNATLTPKE